MAKEIWKDIRGYKGAYQVSNFGKVRSITRKQVQKTRWGTYVIRTILGAEKRPWYDKDGYKIVNISYKGIQKHERVHRLVAEAFIPHENNKCIVNHKNGIKTDNRAENLEWATVFENTYHAHKVLKIRHRSGLKCYQYSKDGKYIKQWPTISEAARFYHVSRTSIHLCLKGKTKSSAGFVWRYTKE